MMCLILEPLISWVLPTCLSENHPWANPYLQAHKPNGLKILRVAAWEMLKQFQGVLMWGEGGGLAGLKAEGAQRFGYHQTGGTKPKIYGFQPRSQLE